MASVVGNYPPGSVSFEHLDIAHKLVVDGDESARSAALCGPVDDELVGGQAGQCSTDSLEVVAAATALGDDVDQLRQAHLVVGDLGPLFAQHREHGRHDQASGTTKAHLSGA